LEREKDAIRDMVQRVQSEKERLNEQYRERISEYEGRIKKLEAER
jgi:arginine decarboxylase-like protein